MKNSDMMKNNDSIQNNKMMKNSDLVKNSIAKYVSEHPEVAVDNVQKFADFYIENKRISKQLKAMESYNEMAMERMVLNYKQNREILSAVFGERFKALNAHYKALNKAIESNDREVVLAALRGINDIVAQNPLESFSEFKRIVNSENEVLKLDF